MRILFITTKDPESQNDLLEVSILHGLRSVMGKNCVDYPRKRIMYHDFSESPKDELHGKGFSVLTEPIEDLTEEERKLDEFDAVIYGDGHMRGEMPEAKYKNLARNGNYWVLDGHDLDGGAPRKIIINEGNKVIEVIGTQFQRSFKRELVENGLNHVYPTGFGIPKHRIMDIDLTKKEQIYQKTAPDSATFNPVRDFGDNTFAHHTFTDEDEYYDDLHRSWFGLTCRKGGWDCLRHYEVIAAGSVLLFRDYNLKPAICSPQCIPCLSYSSKEELDEITNRLVIDHTPTDEYMFYLNRQREWLYNVGTTEARANHILNVIKDTLT